MIICHRALTNGPDEKIENHPDQIKLVLANNFDVEIDVRYIDGLFVLGHNAPQYDITKDFLENTHIWAHCKNIEALYELKNCCNNAFYHDIDDCVLTSKGFIWTFPNDNNTLTNHSIAVLPERVNWKWNGLDKCYGICTDFANGYELNCISV